jgi:hypothetical protein
MDLKRIETRISDLICGNPVVFHHVPKCGGTSVTRALMFRYPTSFVSMKAAMPLYRALESLHPDETEEEIATRSDDLRERLLLLHLYRGVRCIWGHVRYSPTAHRLFADKYRFITTLREPVSLYISTLFWNTSARHDRWKIDGDIEAFLETPRARLFGSLYAAFFAGLPHDADPTDPASVAAAKANLRGFSVVGLVEDMPSFERQLRAALGVRLSIGRHNVARVSSGERTRAVTPAVRRRIEELCAVNTEIYDFARSELAERRSKVAA